MAREWEQANGLQRGLRRFAASTPGSWLFSRMLDRLDRLTFGLTRGKHMFSSVLSALPVVEVEDERRERIWQEALRTYPGFTAYAKRAAPRRISVFVLEPKV